MVIVGPERQKFFNTDDATISLSRMIQDYENGSFLGVILISLNMNKITEICDSFLENSTGALAIVNEAGDCVYQEDSDGYMDVKKLDMKKILSSSDR